MQRSEREPVVSVVIPALNEERYLGLCLRSLRDQDFPDPYEIIVVDNGSTDATAAIARREGARCLSEPKRGVCRARQRGCEAARGTIIVSTDADTIFPRHWLSSLVSPFVEQPDVVGVAGPVRFLPPPRWGAWYSAIVFALVGAIARRTNTLVYVSACNFAFRKQAWAAVGGYNTRLTQGGDEYDLLRRLRRRGRIVYRPDARVATSGRRLQRGFLYNAFVTVGFYYLLEYTLARLWGRSVFGSYPAFREDSERRARWRLVLAIVAFAILVAATAFPSASRHLAHAASHRFRR